MKGSYKKVPAGLVYDGGVCSESVFNVQYGTYTEDLSAKFTSDHLENTDSAVEFGDLIDVEQLKATVYAFSGEESSGNIHVL